MFISMMMDCILFGGLVMKVLFDVIVVILRFVTFVVFRPSCVGKAMCHMHFISLVV
jgi:hypothetical protein